MKLIAPDYYAQFRCIADKCRHSCCIGWEIDVDDDALALYRSLGGGFGREIIDNIDMEETPHFRLDEHERCPFLDSRNLCRIITNLGENALCDICADHPRFRNFFDSRTEIGLGLCCEAAAELIINRQEQTEFIALEDDGDDFLPEDEAEFFALRKDIIAAFQDRSRSCEERISAVKSRYGAALPEMSPSQWAKFFRSLERLAPEWDASLDALGTAQSIEPTLTDTAREQLLIYFAWRHLADGLYDGQLRERIAFCLLSVWLIDAVCSLTGETAAETARRYSAEIEYSDENIQTILDLLHSEFADAAGR